MNIVRLHKERFVKKAETIHIKNEYSLNELEWFTTKQEVFWKVELLTYYDIYTMNGVYLCRSSEYSLNPIDFIDNLGEDVLGLDGVNVNLVTTIQFIPYILIDEDSQEYGRVKGYLGWFDKKKLPTVYVHDDSDLLIQQFEWYDNINYGEDINTCAEAAQRKVELEINKFHNTGTVKYCEENYIPWGIESL